MGERWAAALGTGVHVERVGGALRLAFDRPVEALRIAVGDGDRFLELEAGDEGWAVALPPDPRPLLLLETPDGERRRAAERRLPLAGAANFRDLGGYPAADGRRVRWGRLFRADSLGGLSEQDVAYLARLGLVGVCDLRGDEEVDEEPNRLAARQPFRYWRAPLGDHAMRPGEWRRRFESGELGDLDPSWLARGYCNMLDTCAETLGAIVRELASRDVLPAVFHCTAGKDRTGLLSALVLGALGVPRAVILADYELTSHYTGERRREIAEQLRARGVDVERAMALFSSEPELMETALDRLDAVYGGAQAYLEERAGVSREALEALREALLEDG